MKRVALGLFALAMVLTLARPAMASKITGTVAIGGTDKYTLTGVDFHNPGMVFMGTGSLAKMTPGSTVDLDNFTFASAKGLLLFNYITGGPTDISATILTLTVVQNTKTFLNVVGTATLIETGFSPTHYDISLTSTTTDGVTDYAFTASPVPEPGTLFLVGSGLLGFAGLLFRKARKPVATQPC